MENVIKPLLLSKILSEKGPMTYLAYHGEPIVRPYVMWYVHADGKNILVDTAIEANDYQRCHPAFHKKDFEAVQSFEQALSLVNCETGDIDIVIQTHLHVDHVYNTPKCRNATVYVQKSELDFALNPHPIFEAFYPRELLQSIHFEVLEGDATIVPGIDVMLAPGHSPGCQSVIIHTSIGKVVISGCCTIMDNFNLPEDCKQNISPFATHPAIAPGIHTDLFQAFDSVNKIKKVADFIIPAHDPDLALKSHIP